MGAVFTGDYGYLSFKDEAGKEVDWTPKEAFTAFSKLKDDMAMFHYRITSISAYSHCDRFDVKHAAK